MSTDSAGGGVWASAASLVASPAARTAAVAVCASAILAMTLRGALLTSDKPPKVPDKDANEQTHFPSSSRSQRSLSSFSLSESKNSVAIFWDVDNCSPPTGASGHSVAQAIRRAAQSASKHISNSEGNVSIVSFKAYLELTTEGSQPSAARVLLHSELQGSGVSLIDTPKSGRKDVADKMMITDLLSFAIDKRPPALIVLLSGDRDFAYPLGILRNRGYEILLVVPPIGATPILEASANHVMRWRQDVLALERDGNGKLYDKTAREFENNGGRVIAAKEIDAGKAAKSTPTKATATTSTPSSSLTTLKGPGAPPVPFIFNPLVQALEQMRSEGQSRPLRSQCAMRLSTLDANVYKKAGATTWGDYAAVAEAAGIITLGEGQKPGQEWIALRSIPQDHSSNAKSPEKSTTKQSIALNEDIGIFYPLIEVYKSVKAGLPKTEHPTVAQMTAQLTRMWEVGLRDAYAQAGVSNFTDYMTLAEQAKVGRLVRSETKPTTTVVQIHPKYATLHTGIITPSNNESRMIDTTKATIPIAPTSSRLADVFGLSKKIKESKENGKSTSQVDSNTPSTLKGNEKSTLFHPHQPSGEKIHVSYFPLSNLLLTQRSEGKMASSDAFVQSILVKHPKINHFVSSSEQFASYLARAERDKIIITELKAGKRYLRLHPRLCVGEEEHSRRRGVGGIDSSMKRTDSTQDQREVNDEEESEGETGQTSSPVFAIEAATPQERLRFKPLVDVLVMLRRESPESNMEPQLSKVSSTLVTNHLIDGKTISPGAWIQTQGYSGFVEYYQAAQRKGFIHLLKNDTDTKERIRLAEKYEAMFFHSSS